jgi:hypothetical protein
MKLSAISLAVLALPALAQLDAQPNNLTIEVGPGNTLTDVKRPDNKSRTIKVERNPHDHMTVTYPAVMTMGLNVDLSTVIPPPVGYNVIRVKDTTEVAPFSKKGAFRTVCPYAKIGNIDPIVYPGLPNKSHSHFFMGNTAIDPWTDARLLSSTGNSTCRGGIINRSSYWFPTLIDATTSKPMMPTGNLVYYKGAWSQKEGYGWTNAAGVWVEEKNPDGTRKWPGYATPPVGLKLLGGDPNRQTTPTQYESLPYRWNCRHPATPSVNQFTQWINEDPVKCPVGSELGLELFMPACWDGVNLDSPDHRSHVIHAVNVKNTGDPKGGSHKECPASHPKPLVNVSLALSFRVDADVRNYRLVSDVNVNNKRGITAHWDWFMGWDPKYIEMFMEYCIRGERDCHAHLLGPDPADGKLKAIF